MMKEKRKKIKWRGDLKIIAVMHLLRVYYELTKWPAPSGLRAQLVEHCTGIAEVIGSNPIQA